MNAKQNINKCGGCKKAIKEGECLKCAYCTKYFDLECANVTTHRFYNTMRPTHKDAWKCQQCRSGDRKVDNTNTPVRGADQQVESPQERQALEVHPQTTISLGKESTESERPGAFNITVENLRSLIREEMKDAVAFTVGNLVKQHMQALSDKMDNFCASVTSIQTQLESFKTRFEDRTNTIESLKKENEDLRDSVQHLRHHIRVAEQQALFCDVDIVGVPEANGENVEHVIHALASKLGVTLNANDIVSAVRVGPAVAAAAAPVSVDGIRARARPIAVRLARRALRDDLLREARVRRGATTAGTGLPGEPRRFYINERLTKENRQLLKKAREFGASLKWKYVWSKDGQIFARQTDNSVRYKLNSEANLKSVFNVENIGS